MKLETWFTEGLAYMTVHLSPKSGHKREQSKLESKTGKLAINPAGGIPCFLMCKEVITMGYDQNPWYEIYLSHNTCTQTTETEVSQNN